VRVAVTGATGNVGTAVVRALATDGRITEIVGLARRRPSSTPPIADGSTATVRYVAADVTHDDLRPVLTGVDVVVHLAWKIQPMHRPLETWGTNVLGSIRVFDAIAETGVRALVHASSVGTYSPGPPDGQPVDESWPTDSIPTANYGREKAYVERVLDAFELEHPELRVVRLRPAFIFQREAASEQRRLFAGPLLRSRFPRRLLGHLPILPVPRGLRLQAVHADDVADAYRRAVVGDVHGAFNIAATPTLDGAGLAALLGARRVAVPRTAVRVGLAAAYSARLVPVQPTLLDLFLDLPTMRTDRARDELGWQPNRSSGEAITELVDGLIDGAGGPTPPLVADTDRP
jgi:nucleoside-diphosphate-sugar epimerase